MLVTRTALDKIGPFREDQEIGNFVYWYARPLDDDCRIPMLGSVVMRRRLHQTNMGRGTTSGPEEYARALRRVVDRRRGRKG